MLVEFRVKNYRSIKDEQVFSMVADADDTYRDLNVFKETLNVPALVKTTAIYGANASGKSNLLKAVVFMIVKLRNDAYSLLSDKQDKEYNELLANFASFTPFKLDSKASSTPSLFELTFTDKGIRYQYGFSMDSTKIVEEWLIVYEKNYAQKWFEREYVADTGEYKYTYSKYLKGQKSVWEQSTRPDALYLVTATLLNSEQLSNVYHLIQEDFQLLNLATGSRKICPVWLKRIKEDPIYREKFVDFLRNADLGITDIEIVKSSNKDSPRLRVAQAGENEEQNVSEGNYKILFIHENIETGERVHFNLSEESVGTLKFFTLANDILYAIAEGQIMIVDELENSLHPAMTKAIIELFNSKANKAGQLIFTTHSTELMSPEIFRRDQIWFVEKQKDGASEVYPLSDFSPRKNEKIASRYLAGCYGAVPFIQKFMGEHEQ